MVNVLSIDIDFIMEPCIQLYNDLVDVRVPKKMCWDRIYEERDLKRHISFSPERYKFIYDLILNEDIIDSCKKFYIGKDHSSIINAFVDISKNYKFSVPVNLYNIDHHHDVNYSEESEDCVFLYDSANCGTWCSYLHKYGLINRYFWISNANSIRFNGKKDINPIINRILFEDKNSMQDIINNRYDFIYFTSAFQWIPYEVDEIVDILLKNIRNIYADKLIDFDDMVSHPNNQSKIYF